jgi:SCY1-like protein 1
MFYFSSSLVFFVVLAMLQPLFFITENYLEKDKISRELSPLVALLFNVKDRGVRGALLNKVSFMSQHLDKNSLNTHVFGPLCSGFNDSSPALREMTLKATLGLVPSLNQPNLEKLTRYLVRLQGDNETSIRTNAVIFVSKIAPQMSEMSRDKHILPAYMRSMKDTFPPARLAALQACLQSKDFFSPQDIAAKVLPAVMPILLDPMANVREEAFQVVNSYMQILKNESNRMQTMAQQRQQQQTGTAPSPAAVAPAPSTVAPAPTSRGYMSGLTSWVAGTTTPTPTTSVDAPVAPTFTTAPPMPLPPAPAPPVQQISAITLAAPSPADDDGWGDEDDGWDDDDDGGGDLAFSNIGSSITHQAIKPPQQFSTPNRFDDDPFSAIGMKSAGNRISGGSKLVMNKKKGGGLIIPKAAAPATKLSMDNDDLGDGWDDF